MGSLSNQDLFRSIATRFEKDPGIPVQSPTESFWQIPPCTVANTQSENLPAKVDVAIIGSGISTISTAQHLLHLQPDLSITLLEARTAISGATGRNGGHIMTSPWYFYESSKHENGKERATRLATFQTSHIQAMVDEAKALGVEGEAGQVRQVRILTMVHDQEVWTSVKRRLQAYLDDFPSERDRYKVYEDRASLEKLGASIACGVVQGHGGALWPYRLLAPILSRLLQNENVTLETNTPVTGIERTGSGTHPYKLQTPRGFIEAKHVVHCTNGHAGHLLPRLRGKVWPFRGQMSVQSVPEHFPRLGASTTWAFIWEKGLDYLSQSPNADGKLYLGGGIYHNHQSNQFHDLGNSDDSTCCQTCVDRLNALPNKVFTAGKGTEIVHKWSGVMGFTSDQLPLIDKLPSDVTGKENSNDNSGGEWISAGFNGLGMNLCWLGGKGLAAMICGKTDGLERWFPVDEFACTRARLDAMDSVDMVRHIIDAPFE